MESYLSKKRFTKISITKNRNEGSDIELGIDMKEKKGYLICKN